MKNISTPRFYIVNIRADGEKAESARHLNRARQQKRERSRTGKGAEQGKERNRERSRTEKGAEQSEAAEQRKAAEAPHEQGRTKKSLKPDWEEAGAGTAAEAYPKQYNHDNDK